MHPSYVMNYWIHLQLEAMKAWRNIFLSRGVLLS